MRLSSHPLRRGFTLVELLCVMVIFALLFGMIAYNARDPLDSSAVTSGANQLYNGLGLARQTALQRNTPAILVLRTTGEHAWQRFAIFSVDHDTGRWAPVTAWQNLPRQARMDDNFTLPEGWSHTIGLASASALMTAPTEPLRDGASPPLILNNDYLAIGFLPDGCLLPSDRNVALRIVSPHKGERTQWPVLLAESSAGRVKVLW